MTLLGDRTWAEQALWAIDTANKNSWQTVLRQVVQRSQADILLLQETKMSEPQKYNAATLAARAAGWNPTFSYAHLTCAARASGGMGVLTRRGMGIHQNTDEVVRDGMRHRIAISWVDGVQRGGVHCGSIWLFDPQGLSAANMALLEKAAAALLACQGGWILGGDWNISPDLLQSSKWLEIVGGVICCTTLPTCNGSTYDFFVVHRSLAHAVVGVQRIDDGCTPHWQSRLLLRGDARRLADRKLVKPPKVEAHLPFGPKREPPDYEQVFSLAAKAQTLDAGMREWFRASRLEWNDLSGNSSKFQPARFIWTAACGQRAQRCIGASSASVMWRVVARRTQDIARIVGAGMFSASEAQRKAVSDHLTAAAGAARTLCNSQRASVESQITGWARSLRAAVAHASLPWLHSLARVADMKAKLLETATSRARARIWKARFGVVDGSSPHAAPTKVAYRWVRGLVGWQHSPIGSAETNDSVPDEGEDDDVDPGPHTPDELPTTRAPLADQMVVESHANDLAQLWHEGRDYTEPAWPADSHQQQQLERLLPWAIRIAASTFPPGTGLGADNIAPRAFSRLSEEGLVALAFLFAQFELAGSWASVLDLVLIVLLPKPEGGFRLIGLFPTVVRIWMRARGVCVARPWEAAHAVPCLFGGAGMGAQRAAWEAAFSAEMAGHMDEHHLQALLDLVKAFETIPHDLLCRAATEKGYNIVILRLSIAAYRLSRAVRIDGVFSRRIRAVRGITASSGFATSELRLLLQDVLQDVIERVRRNWSPSIVSLKLYVDDLTVAVTGSTNLGCEASRGCCRLHHLRS